MYTTGAFTLDQLKAINKTDGLTFDLNAGPWVSEEKPKLDRKAIQKGREFDKYRMVFASGACLNNPQAMKVPLEFFTANIGYDDETYREIADLKVGESCAADGGAQTIYRMV